MPLRNSCPDGIHYLIEFFGCSDEHIDSVSHWEKLLRDAIEHANIKALHSHFYKFDPHGITGYLLLSASHISIHTWPEYAYIACDFFSCGGDDEAKEIVRNIKKCIPHTSVKSRKLKRGFRVSPKAERPL